MRALARWRWPIGFAAIVALGAIWLLGPKYAQLQLAPDADEFRRIVGDERGRYIGAFAADVAFAALYGLLAVAIARAPLASRLGAALVVLGSVFDQVENSLLVANIAEGASLSDGRVELMRAVGVAKFGAVATGSLLYVGAWLVERSRGRRRRLEDDVSRLPGGQTS